MGGFLVYSEACLVLGVPREHHCNAEHCCCLRVQQGIHGNCVCLFAAVKVERRFAARWTSQAGEPLTERCGRWCWCRVLGAVCLPLPHAFIIHAVPACCRLHPDPASSARPSRLSSPSHTSVASHRDPLVFSQPLLCALLFLFSVSSTTVPIPAWKPTPFLSLRFL